MPEIYNKNDLLQILRACFNDDELRTLCFQLDVDYDSLGGEAKTGKARELVSYFQRSGRLAELGDAILREHPNAFELAKDLQQRTLGQTSKPDSMGKWIVMAFLSSKYLLDIGATIKATQLKQSRLCQLVADATSDLPDQKRVQIMNIIENDCGHCRTIWSDIKDRVENGVESWQEFISENCTDQECETYTEHLTRARAKLSPNVR